MTGFDESEIDDFLELSQEIENEQGKEIEFEQSVQMEPSKEFLVILMTQEEYEEAKDLLALKQVRRGGYKEGSAFDAVGFERAIKWERIKNAVCGSK